MAASSEVEGGAACRCPPPNTSPTAFGGCMCNTMCSTCEVCGQLMCWTKAGIYRGVDFSGLDESKYVGRPLVEVCTALEAEFPRCVIVKAALGETARAPPVKIVTSRMLAVLHGPDGAVARVAPLDDLPQ